MVVVWKSESTVWQQRPPNHSGVVKLEDRVNFQVFVFLHLFYITTQQCRWVNGLGFCGSWKYFKLFNRILFATHTHAWTEAHAHWKSNWEIICDVVADDGGNLPCAPPNHPPWLGWNERKLQLIHHSSLCYFQIRLVISSSLQLNSSRLDQCTNSIIEIGENSLIHTSPISRPVLRH